MVKPSETAPERTRGPATGTADAVGAGGRRHAGLIAAGFALLVLAEVSSALAIPVGPAMPEHMAGQPVPLTGPLAAPGTGAPDAGNRNERRQGDATGPDELLFSRFDRLQTDRLAHRPNPYGGADPAFAAPGPAGRSGLLASSAYRAGNSAAAPAAHAADGSPRLRDFLRILTNIQPGQDRAPSVVSGLSGRSAPRTASGEFAPAGSLVDLLLNTTLDDDLRDFLTKIVTPSIEPAGFVSFSILGLGRFVLLFSDDDRSLRMIDLDGPFSLTVAQPRMTMPAGTVYGLESHLGMIEPSARGGQATLHELLDFMRAQLIGFLLNPLTIGGILLSIVLWLVWRIRGRVA